MLTAECCLLVRDHPRDFGVIGIAHHGGSTQLPFTLRVFRGKNVALISHGPFDLSGPGLFKPFGCAAVCLHFRHNLLFEWPSYSRTKSNYPHKKILHPDAAPEVTPDFASLAAVLQVGGTVSSFV
jgi:hypothetical protein